MLGAGLFADYCKIVIFFDFESFRSFPYAGQQWYLPGLLINLLDNASFLSCALAACIESIFVEFLAPHNFENFSRPSKKIKRSDNFDKLKQDKKQHLSQKRNSQSPIWTKLGFCPSVWWVVVGRSSSGGGGSCSS